MWTKQRWLYFERVVYYLIMIFGFMVTLTLKLLMLSITLALIYHTQELFHVLKEILLIGVYVLSML